MMEDNIKQSDSLEMLFNVAEELCGLVLREHQLLQRELNQVGVLVEDAVQSLGSNLRILNECMIAQNKILAQHNPRESADTSMEFSSISKRLSKNTSEMMRALQFDDIVQQLSRHAGDRVSQMQSLFHMLDTHVSELKILKSENSDDIRIKLHEMIHDISTYRQSLEKSNPVKQNSMSEGKIEIF